MLSPMLRLCKHYAWLLLWALLCAMAVVYLPGFSEYDTSKYLAIAHQMIDNHQFTIAYWEGHVYSDKPPLLFWLIIAGWKLFGVNDWWPQLLVMGLATGSLGLTLSIAKELWPERPTLDWLLPLIIVGCFHWFWFAREIRVDSLLTCAVLLCFWSLLNTLKHKKWAWPVYVLAVGLGGFAKGPVILVFVLLPALLLPHCLPKPMINHRRWYRNLLATTLLGLCLPLCWAIPAIWLGGKSFMHQIFFDQIAHRATQQRESKWFYVIRLPLYTLPWSLYPPMWQGLASTLRQRSLNTTTWCVTALVIALLVFSFFGQKLPHYLFPALPLLLMLMAVAITERRVVSRLALWPMAWVLLGLGAFCLSYLQLAPLLPSPVYARGYFLTQMPLLSWGIALICLGFCLLLAHTSELKWQIGLMTTSSLVLTWFVNTQVIAHYQTHIQRNSLQTLLAHADPEQVALAPHSAVTNPEILEMLAAQHIKLIPVADPNTWLRNHPHGLVLTSNLDDFRRQPIQQWWFQERYTLLGVLSTD